MARWLGLNLLLALAYYGAARAGIGTSIGPAGVTVLWAPSGLALGALLLWSWRALPGLFGGAFLLEWLSFLLPKFAAHAPAMAGAIALSSASMLQAGLAAWLLRGLPARLQEAPTRHTLHFACCVALCSFVAPTLGSSYLQAVDLLPADDLAYSWLVWWTGDCAGMLVVAPLLLVWLNGTVRRDPIASLTFPLVSIGVGLTLIITSIVGHLERDARIGQFRAQSRGLVVALQHAIDFTQRDLEVLAALHHRTQVSYDEFRRLAHSMHERSPWQQNLSWLPRLNGSGAPARFGRLWTVPLAGLDTVGARQESDDPQVSSALQRAAMEGHTSATGLLTGLDGQWLTLRLYGPVVEAARDGEVDGSEALPHRPERVLGLVAVTLDLSALLTHPELAARSQSLNLQWFEAAASPAPAEQAIGVQLLGATPQLLKVADRWTAQTVEERLRLQVADQAWTLVTRPRALAQWVLPTPLQIGVFGSGLAFTALLVGVLVLRRRRDLDQASEHERLTREVAERTQALSDSNQRLNAELRERVLLERALRDASGRAEAANQAKSMFLANMSHEIRTPLNAVIGYAQLLCEDERLPTQARERIHAIDAAGRRLLQLINDVLDLSKIEAGNLSLNPEVFELGRELQDVTRLMRQRAESKGLTLSLLLDQPQPCWVRTDRHKLGQILLNLLGNAIKFTAEGRVLLRVYFEGGPRLGGAEAAEGNASRWVAEIEDTGPGMDAAEQRELFEPFRQGSSGHAQGGTGLGLALSRRLAEALGGELTLTSTPGQGTCVRLMLPLPRLAAPASPGPAQAARLRVRLREGAPPCRLLVVEDDPDSRAILVQTLSALGAEVAQASQGLEALALLERQPVDLVFTDIRMPELDGLGLLRRIRERWGSALAVVAVSASSLEHERRFYVGEGFQDFVGKPYDLQQIYRLLLHYLPGQWVEEPESASAGQTTGQTAASPAPAAAAAASGDRAAPAPASPQGLALLQHLAAAARDGDVVTVRQTHQALLALPERALDPATAQQLAQAVQFYDFDAVAALAERCLATASSGDPP